MTSLASLWLPILISAVLLFFLSAASHMALPWRKGEWKRIAGFEAVQGALKGLPPGLYSFPAAPDPKQQMTPEWTERWAKGPSGWLTLAPPGPIRMGRNMALSLLVFFAVALLEGYVAAQALAPGAPYPAVFRLVSTVGVMTFGVSSAFTSIWYHRPWRAYLSDLFDALLFAFAMAGVFGWLWPR
ncbi:MAG TPA: hypothetical protein VLT47_01860 [Anaeromyxobacteraceae bacterium]|nr:hypothetical protein [Anaeromyxobacteraceae bacterium]